MSVGPITAFALSINSAAIVSTPVNTPNVSLSIVTPTGQVLLCGRDQIEVLLRACQLALSDTSDTDI